jgi:hypothetical protein
MGVDVRKVEYFHCTVLDRPGQAAELLGILAEAGVDLLAFSIVPVGEAHTQLMLFPAVPNQLTTLARRSGIELSGPQYALLVRGDNELGGLAVLHADLAQAGVNVYASSGVTDATGGFGYVLYVRPDDFARAARAAGITSPDTWRPRAPVLQA